MPAAALCACALALLAGDPPFAPTDAYESRTVRGWTVLVGPDLLADEPELADRALELLDQQLYQVTRAVPAEALAKLREVRIWLERDEPHHPCMAYHPDPGWLRAHGMNPDKARCVEVADARTFLDWTHTQPWMVLHELAHAYHHQVLSDGYGNPEVRAAFDAATEGGTYETVLHGNGRETRHYALNNPMEYFAECSEAYFGTNDFYPFVRSELRRHDPDAAELLGRLWGDDR